MPPLTDRWPQLCQLVAQNDGLPTRDAGSWTEDKLYFWNRYIDITTRAMVGSPKWSGVAYLDLFAGPGICTLRETGKRIPGSALIAAHAPKAFSRIIACEKDRSLASALQTRLQSTSVSHHCHVVEGDCNVKAHELSQLIPPGALTLAFVDPTGLHADFDTLRAISAGRQVDLLILFSDRNDVVRNVGLYRGQDDSNLDRVLGPDSEWRDKYDALGNQNAENTCQLFETIYQEQLQRHLGYIQFGRKVMRTQRGPLYRLIYASKHPLGLEFWEKITKKDRGGQGQLF